MQRTLLSLAALSLLAVSLTGCCCSHLCGGGYGAGYAPAPACPPCGPTYGATYAPSGTVMSPGCPNGNCGMYPSGAFYGPAAPVAAAMPVPYAMAGLPIDPLPTY